MGKWLNFFNENRSEATEIIACTITLLINFYNKCNVNVAHEIKCSIFGAMHVDITLFGPSQSE